MTKYLSKITIETSETFVIKYRRHFLRAYCAQCQREVGMISPYDASILSGNDLDAIDVLIRTGKFHLYPVGEEKSFICLNSLCLI